MMEGNLVPEVGNEGEKDGRGKAGKGLNSLRNRFCEDAPLHSIGGWAETMALEKSGRGRKKNGDTEIGRGTVLNVDK